MGAEDGMGAWRRSFEFATTLGGSMQGDEDVLAAGALIAAA
jgi:hypothetical protein